MALLILVMGGATAPAAHAYIKAPPVYTEDGSSVADDALDWLKKYGDDVASEFDLSDAGSGVRQTSRIAKSARFLARGFGWLGVAYGAYEVCDSFFEKGCWLIEQDARGPASGSVFSPSDGPYLLRVSGQWTYSVDPETGENADVVAPAASALNGLVAYVKSGGTTMGVANKSPSYCTGSAPPGVDGVAWLDGPGGAPAVYQCGGEIGEIQIRTGVYYRLASETVITPPRPTVPNDPAVPDLDVETFPLPDHFPEEWGDDLAEDDNEDDRRQVEEDLPRPIPAVQPGETYQHYITRLQAAGLVGVALALTDATLDPDYGPNQVVRTNPATGTKVQPGTEVEVVHNPPTAPEVPGGGGGGGGGVGGSCDTPDVRSPNFGPLMVDFSNVFPFGIFAWLDDSLGGLVGGGVAPEIDIPMPGDIEPLHISFEPFSSLMSNFIHPAILLLSFISLVYLLASTAAGLGRPSEE